jgi:cathepsin L
MNAWIVLSVLLAVATAATVPNSISNGDLLNEEWETFKLTYGKQYADPHEEAFRMKVYLENRHRIAQHNRRQANGLKSYTLGMNKYGDIMHHEFTKTMNGYKLAKDAVKHNGSAFLTPKNIQVPDSVDWREEGYVTPVKDQGQCGSCWSFSTTGALEGQHKRQTGTLVSLSEQNLVDCSKKFGNNGCEGGLMDNAFAYIKENHGIDTEASYPYEGTEGKCRYTKRKIGATDTGFVDIPAGSETHLQQALATVGPVSVAIDASHESFQFYKHGVYDEPECSSEELDHGVLAVGYGTDAATGLDYWIVKNSWSTTWGDQGYVKMVRNKKNQCGIATSASYPLV